MFDRQSVCAPTVCLSHAVVHDFQLIGVIPLWITLNSHKALYVTYWYHANSINVQIRNPNVTTRMFEFDLFSFSTGCTTEQQLLSANCLFHSYIWRWHSVRILWQIVRMIPTFTCMYICMCFVLYTKNVRTARYSFFSFMYCRLCVNGLIAMRRSNGNGIWMNWWWATSSYCLWEHESQ